MGPQKLEQADRPDRRRGPIGAVLAKTCRIVQYFAEPLSTLCCQTHKGPLEQGGVTLPEHQTRAALEQAQERRKPGRRTHTERTNSPGEK